MTIVDVIAAIVVLVSVIGLLLSIDDSKSEPGDSSNTGAVTFTTTVIVINVSFYNTSVQPTETIDTPFEVINPPMDWKMIQPQKLVKMVIEWGKNNIVYGKSRRIIPSIKINYKKSGNLLGTYSFKSKVIEIFVRKHETLESIVDTIIHEYVHHLQLRNQNDDMKYDSNSRRVGYYDNPFEVEARELARKYRKQCIADLNLR